MDEKYIDDLYSQLGGKNKFGSFNDFKNLMQNDAQYRKDFHSSIGEETLGNFNDFEGLVKKKDGQIGGQEQKKGGVPPTQSPSKSQLPEVKKTGEAGSAFNPLSVVKNVVQQQQQKPYQFSKTEPVNTEAIANYESAQQIYSLADKNRASVLNKDKHSMLSPIPIVEDIGNALMNTVIPGREERQKKEKNQIVYDAEVGFVNSRKQAMAAQEAVKKELPKLLTPLSDNWQSYITSTKDNVPIVDDMKISEYAKKIAKDNNVNETGMFYSLLKKEATSLVTQKLIQPEVEKTLRVNYKKKYGRDLDVDLNSESNQAAIKLEEIKNATTLTQKKLQTQIFGEARTNVEAISNDISGKVNLLNDEIKLGLENLNNKYGSLIKDNKFIGTQEQFDQYQLEYNELQKKDETNKQAFGALNKEFLDQQNLIYSKANARFRREMEEVVRIKKAEYEKFKPKANPQLQKNIENIYGEAYNEVLNKNQELRRQMSSKNSFLENLKSNMLSALGGQIRGYGESMGFANMSTFGQAIQNYYAQDVPEFKSVGDYLDLQKLSKSTGQFLGGMLPSMTAGFIATAATGGSAAPIGVQLVSSGLASWGAETMASAGNMKADVYAETGDIAAANNAERQTIAFQVDILPLYAFSGLPFIGKGVSKIIGKAAPSAVRATSPTIAKIAKVAENKWVAPLIAGTAESVEETMQEYPQNLADEAIRKEGSYANMFDYHTKEKFQNTLLNIVPQTFLFGAAGEAAGESEESRKERLVQESAKAFALKTKFSELAPGQKEQFLFDVMQRQGAPFAAAYLTSAYGSGQMDKATFEGMQETYAKQVEMLKKTEELGLTPVQAKLYNAFSTYHQNEKNRFDEEEDPILKTVAGVRMAEYEAALANIALKREPDYSVVVYPDNTQMVFMPSELENALKNPAFANALSNGDIKVSVFGNSESLNAKIEETKTSVAAAQKEEQRVAKENEQAVRKEIETNFNVEIKDNLKGMGVEVVGLGTEEQTEQAKQALREAGINLREDDTENIPGLPSQVGEGQELVTTEPQQGTGTETTSAGGVLQAQGLGGQVQGAGQKILAPINVSNKTELTGLQERTQSDKNKSAVLESAKKAIATLKSVFPDMDIFIHEDGDAYNQTVVPIGGNENSRGNFAFERDENDVPTGKGRIDINLSNASETTVAHEVTHAVLLKAFGDSPATFKKFRDRISPILRADLNKDLLEFEDMYKGKAVAPEEYLTQLSALLSKGAETVEYKPSTLRKIAAVINEFVANITKGKFQPFKGEVDFKNFVDFLNQMAQAIEKGDVIEGLTEKINTNAEPNKTEVDTSSLTSKSSLIQDLGLKRIVGMNKRITEGVTIKDLGDVKSHLTFSDRLVTGKVGGKNYLGGILFAAATNRVWASFTKTKVSQIIKGMPKNEDGYRYLMPALLTEGAHMSNKNMSNTAIKLVEDAISKNNISPIDADSRIRKALNRKGLEGLSKIYSDTIGNNNLTSQLVISAIDNAIIKSNSNFEERNAFLESLLGKADIDLNKRFGGLPSYGVLANGLAEPITNGHDFGDILLVIRTKGDLIAVQPKEGDSDYHESYPWVIRAVNPDGSIADVETLIFKNSYNAVNVFPEITNKQGQKITYKQYVDKYGDSAKTRYLQYIGARTAMSTSVTENITVGANAKSKVNIKTKSQLEEKKALPLGNETKDYGQKSKSTEDTTGGKGVSKSITTGEEGVGKERPYNAESYSNPDGTPQYAVKRGDRDGGKRLDITVNGNNTKAKAVYTQSEQLKSSINNYRNAYTDKYLIELDDPKLFHKLINQSKKVNEYAASVHVYEPKEYAKMRLFITPDGKAGVALKPDGDLVSGFSNKEADKPRRIAQLLGLAIKEGATKADSFDTVLPQYYIDFGLLPVAQDKWNEEFKPEKWDKEVFKQWNNGEPDVIYYVYKGGDRATISERAGEFGSWKDLKKDVPYAEYDDAVKIQEENIKSKAQLPEQVEATAKALEDVGEEAKDTIKYNYQDSFGFNDFDWNEESKRENFREWLSDFEEKQFNKNLPKVIKEVKEDIELLKEKELSDAKLRDFEDLIIPSLGNEALVPILSKFEEDILLDPELTLEQMEEGFRQAKNIIDEDGSLNMRKIETGEILNKEKRISLRGFERFVENNPDYKGVFDAWKKIFDKDIELTLKETNAFRSPSIKELENLYKDLTKSQLPKQDQKGVGEVKTEGISIKSKAQLNPLDSNKGIDNKDFQDYDGMFSKKNASSPYITDLLNDEVNGKRGYQLFYKRRLASIEMMSPEEYLRRVRVGQNDTVEGQKRVISQAQKDRIKVGIEKGDKIDMPSLSYDNKGNFDTQEGRHRATIAKERGEKLIPVVIERGATEKDLMDKAQEIINEANKDLKTNDIDEIINYATDKFNLHRDAVAYLNDNASELKTEVPTTIISKSQKTKVNFGEGQEGKDNKKEFDKLTSTMPNSGEVTKYLSGETIEKYEGEKPRNEQEVVAQQLRPALERGVDIIEKAKELFGDKYIESLLQYVETENLPPANKALIYVSLENEVAKQKLENPDEAAKIEKMQDLVRAKSQAFLRSNSLAINMGRLRKFAEVGYDVNRLTDRFFSSRQLEDKKKIEDALQATADDINKEAAQQLQDEIDNKEKIENNNEEEIAKIFEQLPEKRKTVIKKAISAIDRMMGRFSVKMSSRYKSRSDLNSILENGTKKIKNALRAGIKIEDAVEMGIESMKKEHEKEYSQKWADEDTFRRNITQELNAAGLLTPIPKLFTKNALIEKGYGKEINVKTKNGIEKRTILDWKKLAGEEGSVDKIKEKVESVLKDRGYTDTEISQMQQEFIDEYNDLRQSIVEKSLNEINARNKEATTPEQKSAVRKLVEMYNYGLFDKDPNAYEFALAKTVGLKGLSLENFTKVKELGDVMSNLFNSNFEGKPLNETQLRSAIQVIEEKMRVILNSEAMKQGGTAFKLSEIVKEYMDASQRMMLNTVKQGIENPISGLLERFYSSIGYAGTLPEQLNAQQRKMARDIYKEMVLQKGMGYGNVGNAFISKGSLDAHIHNMSDSELVQGIMSIAMGKTILDAVDSAYKAKITQQKFTYNLIKILTQDRMVNGKLEKGMTKEEAKRYVAEKISGQSFEDAKKTAKNIIEKINTQAGKKIFNDSPEFVNRLATDIVNAALINGEKITEEMVTAAYNAAYRAAGRGLGHVANNPISEQINTGSGKLESRIADAIKQKKFAKATYLNLYSIFYRNIANPFIGGGTNWIVLKAEKTGLGLLSGLISMYKDRGSKMDLMTDTGMKELEDVMFNSMKTKDKFIRGAVGGAVTALAFMLIKATGADDEYEKWIKKNQWAKKYLTILTPEIMLAMLAAREKGAYTKYLESSFNKNEAFDKGKMAIKAASYLTAGEKEKAAGQAGQLVGASIGNPIPWRLVRDGQQLWVGATGGEPYAVNPSKPTTFMEGYLKGGFVDYLGYAPQSEDKTKFTKKEYEKFSNITEGGLKIPELNKRTSYKINIDESHPEGVMTEKEYDVFVNKVKEYEKEEYESFIDSYSDELNELKSLLDKKNMSESDKADMNELKDNLQDKIQAMHNKAIKEAKREIE